ncbi:MAG: sulfatase-like hydrolase/transferase [Acidobacteria bacterium]|nr:sulfatase-like hydrolase/transferase [Acidobacteriota bacterium]
MKRFSKVTAVLWVVLGLVAAKGAAAPPSIVVLVSVDTLRADFVSFDGHRPRTTPFMDTLARQGIVFRTAYSTSSWTPPAMGSLLTGLYPTSHGVTTGNVQHVDRVEQPPLPRALTTLAEMFHRAGYTTIGVPANRHLMARLGFAQGFDFYYREAAFLPAVRVNDQVRKQLLLAFGPEWRKTWKRGKVFLWIHYFDPHDPYFARHPWIDRYAPEYEEHPQDFPANMVMKEIKRRFPHPDAALGARIRPLYESEISYWDAHFRRLALQLGLNAPNVLLIFTADHGEEMAEHGALGHSQSLHEELVRVPLLVRWPEGLPQGVTVMRPVSIVDIMPTMAQLAGIVPPRGLQGRSLVPLMMGKDRSPARPVYMELFPPKPHLLAIRSGPWKLIRGLGSSGRVALYDLRTDPGEHHDVASTHRKLVFRLQNTMADWYRGLPPAPTAKPVPLRNKKIEEELRSLGYLQ